MDTFIKSFLGFWAGALVVALFCWAAGVFDDPTIPEPVGIVGVNESAPGDNWEQVVTYKGKPLHCIRGYHSNLDCDFVRYHKENSNAR